MIIVAQNLLPWMALFRVHFRPLQEIKGVGGYLILGPFSRDYGTIHGQICTSEGGWWPGGTNTSLTCRFKSHHAICLTYEDTVNSSNYLYKSVQRNSTLWGLPSHHLVHTLFFWPPSAEQTLLLVFWVEGAELATYLLVNLLLKPYSFRISGALRHDHYWNFHMYRGVLHACLSKNNSCKYL